MRATPWIIMTDLSTNIWAVMALTSAMSLPVVTHEISNLPADTHLIKEVQGQFFEYQNDGAWKIATIPLSARLNIGCNQSCLSLFGVKNQANTDHDIRYYASLPPQHKQKSDAIFLKRCLQEANCQLTLQHTEKGVF